MVNLIPPPFFRGIMDWTDPLPYEFSPKIIALLWSFNAPAKISEADAEPLFIKTTIGLPFISSPFLAKNFLVSEILRPFVDTISPSSKKKSVIFIAWVSKPPGLFLRSKTYPIILDFYSKFLRDLRNCLSLFSLKDFSLM